MRQNLGVATAIVVMVGGLVAGAQAGGAKTDYDGEISPTRRFDQTTQTCRNFTYDNIRSGYLTFRKVCKSCHKWENNEGATFLHTESKSTKAWNRVFSEKYPTCARNGAWTSLSLDDRLNLNDYLYRNGSGTYNPNCPG